jgi:hypothetical protein
LTFGAVSRKLYLALFGGVVKWYNSGLQNHY